MFKPQLAPNQQIDLNTLSYPLVASTKIDGMRMIVKGGELITRSLKPIMSNAIKERFAFLAKYAKDNKIILDGELYAPSLSFSELSGQCRAFDAEIVDDLCFYCFDVLHEPCEQGQSPYAIRIREIDLHYKKLNNKYFKVVSTREVKNAREVHDCFDLALEHGFEGLILRNPMSHYKFGRATVKENIIFKVKPFRTFDAKITGIIQATEVRAEAEKKINELGRSVTSKKLGDRIPIEKAAAFTVLYEGKELKVTIAMTDEEKIEIWKNKERYIGKWVEYKGMLIGAKDLPRHPTTIRLREDKDE